MFDRFTRAFAFGSFRHAIGSLLGGPVGQHCVGSPCFDHQACHPPCRCVTPKHTCQF